MKIPVPKDRQEAADIIRRYAQDAILAAINADRAADRQRRAQGEFNQAREAAGPFLTRSQIMSIWDVAYSDATGMSEAAVRSVIYDEERQLWIYHDTREPATLADTMASLAARPW